VRFTKENTVCHPKSVWLQSFKEKPALPMRSSKYCCVAWRRVAPRRAACFIRRTALDLHKDTEHFKTLVRELTPLLAYPLDVTVLEALIDD
jgi:hypothetical protein